MIAEIKLVGALIPTQFLLFNFYFILNIMQKKMFFSMHEDSSIGLSNTTFQVLKIFRGGIIFKRKKEREKKIMFFIKSNHDSLWQYKSPWLDRTLFRSWTDKSDPRVIQNILFIWSVTNFLFLTGFKIEVSDCNSYWDWISTKA